MLFKFLSCSKWTPTPSHSLVERECHIKWWMSWSPASDKDAVKEWLGKQKSEQTWSEVNGKCSDQVSLSCKWIRFILSTVSSLASQSFLKIPHQKQTNVKTLTMGVYRQTVQWALVKRSDERRWSEWLHQVLIYHDSKCIWSIKNYLGAEHWPLSDN